VLFSAGFPPHWDVAVSLPEIPDFLRSDPKTGTDVTARRTGFVSQVIDVIEGGNTGWRRFTGWLERHFSFWPFVLTVALLSAGYFYVIASPLYVSEATINLRSKSQQMPSFGGILSSLTGGDNLGSQNAALMDHIQSYEMLRKLDQRFHLRKRWSSPDRNIFERLSPSASEEDFRNYYLSMISVSLQPDVGLIEVDVNGFTANEAAEMNAMIIAESEKFMNAISEALQRATLKFAENELRAASQAVATAQPIERDYAERRLSAAQDGLAAAAGVASQQQIFVVRISGPNVPTKATLPRAFLNTLGITILAGVLYIIGYLLWSNIRDHRRA
jgi:capsular polysaccharide transport system permease protein